jgi:hypothetical protein
LTADLRRDGYTPGVVRVLRKVKPAEHDELVLKALQAASTSV